MLVAGKAYLVRTLMNDKELCGANYERNVRDGQVQVPTGPRARRRSGRPGHGTGQRLRPAGPADLRRDELPAGRVVAVVEHQEREHSEARDAGDRVVDAAAQIVPDAATERPRRLQGTYADWRGPDGKGRVRPRTAGAGRIVPVPLRLEILHGAAPRDAHGEGPLRAPRDRLERGDSGHVARQTDRGDQEPPVAGPVEAPDGRAERAALRTGPRHRGPRMVQEDRRPAYGSVSQPTGPERDPHRRPGVLEGRIRDRGLCPP